MGNQQREAVIFTLVKEGKHYKTDDEKARMFAENIIASETFSELCDSSNLFCKSNYEKVTDYVKNNRYEDNYSSNQK